MADSGHYNLRSAGQMQPDKDREEITQQLRDEDLRDEDLIKSSLQHEITETSLKQPVSLQADDQLCSTEKEPGPVLQRHVVSSQGDNRHVKSKGHFADAELQSQSALDTDQFGRHSLVRPAVEAPPTGDILRPTTLENMGKGAPDYRPFTTHINDRFIDESSLSEGGNEPLMDKNSQCRFTATPPSSMSQGQSCTQFDDRGQPLRRQTVNFQRKPLKRTMSEHDKEAYFIDKGPSMLYTDTTVRSKEYPIYQQPNTRSTDYQAGRSQQPTLYTMERCHEVAPGPSGDVEQPHNERMFRRHNAMPEWYMPPGGEPRLRLPTYDGKGDWRSFWIKFSLLADKYGWDEQTELSQLVSCLQDDAMFFVSRLATHIRTHLGSLKDALERRFGDHVLPETHRVALQNVKKTAQESLQEYAARVQTLVSRAYPGLEGTEIFTSITIEYLVNGLQDPNLVYDVMTKRPKSIQQTLDMIAWHECCRGTARKRNIRKIAEEDNNNNNNNNARNDIRRTSGQRYVTEERLQHFGRDLKESLVHSVKEAVKNQVQSLMEGQSGSQQMARTQQRRWRNLEGDQAKCFNCKKPGHFIRDCPAVVRTGSQPGPRDDPLN